MLDWGIEIVLWLQNWSPTLDLPFRSITWLGNEGFFLLVLPWIYWCVDRRLGLQVSILLMLSFYINALCKGLLQQPRPFAYDMRVRPLVQAGSGGLPSGHAQVTVVFWGYLATQLSRPWLWGTTAILLILIPLSRMYLGVHFPTDLLGGYLLGTLLLVLFLWGAPTVERQLLQYGWAWRHGLAVGAPLLLILGSGGGQYGVTVGAVLMGLGYGAILERHWVAFHNEGSMWHRMARFLLGIASLIALRYGLQAAFADLQPDILFRILRYGVAGLWISFGAPWAFVYLGLASSERLVVPHADLANHAS
jgi:membrane-associated phospholipid phosphatase